MSEPTVVDRLRRLESRVVVGFEKLGIDVKSRNSENITVNEQALTVAINSPGISIQALVDKLPHDSGEDLYTVTFDNRIICVISRE